MGTTDFRIPAGLPFISSNGSNPSPFSLFILGKQKEPCIKLSLSIVALIHTASNGQFDVKSGGLKYFDFFSFN